MRLRKFVALLLGATAAHAAAPLGPHRQPLAAMPIVKRIKVPIGPAWLETGFGSVWVSKTNSRAVLRIDPATNKVIATIPVGAKPELGIGIGLGFVWIADTHGKSLIQIDPTLNRVVRKIPVKISDDTEGSIGVGEGSIWVLTDEGGTDSGTLSRIDAVTGKIMANIPVKPKSHAALVAFDAVWVSGSASATVTRVDPLTNTVTADISVHQSPRFMASGEGSLWAVSQGDGTLARIDPVTNQVIATIDVGVPGEGGDLSIGEGFVWVSAERVPLSQIDPQSNHVMRQFAGGRRDDTLRVGFGSAWIVDEIHGQIWRVDLSRLSGLPL